MFWGTWILSFFCNLELCWNVGTKQENPCSFIGIWLVDPLKVCIQISISLTPLLFDTVLCIRLGNVTTSALGHYSNFLSVQPWRSPLDQTSGCNIWYWGLCYHVSLRTVSMSLACSWLDWALEPCSLWCSVATGPGRHPQTRHQAKRVGGLLLL